MTFYEFILELGFMQWIGVLAALAMVTGCIAGALFGPFIIKQVSTIHKHYKEEGKGE